MNNVVESKRIIYTPSEFAKESLIYIQEIGQTKALKKHTSSRNKLDSYLFFIVLDGTGSLNYNGNNYKLSKGSCVFIDCNKNYSHTSDNWSIEWVHFNGLNSKKIYDTYLQNNNQNVFTTSQIKEYQILLDNVQNISISNEFYKDMSIYNCLTALLYKILTESIHEQNTTKQKYNIYKIKEYIDYHYLENISLDFLSRTYYINKYYLTRLFKSTYGTTIKNYILIKRINKAKSLLRFSNLSIEDIAIKCSFCDANYFSRIFKKTEGTTPKKYRQIW